MKRLLAIALILSACTTVQPQPQEQTPVQQEPEQKAEPCSVHTWCYVQQTKDALNKYGQALLAANPSDYKAYCGSSAKLDCYNAILHGMSVFESGINPTQTYQENFKDAKGAYVISTGLLQVSVESCRSYGSSATSTEDLKSPDKNLECAVRILNRWVPKDGVISGGSKGAWLGGARYWSVLREHGPEIKQKAMGYLK